MPNFPKEPIENQKKIIHTLIDKYAADLPALRAALLKSRFKPAAVIALINENAADFSPSVIDILNEKRIHTQIGCVKEDRKLLSVGEKPGGRTAGGMVRKERVDEASPANAAKYTALWLQKSGYAPEGNQGNTGIGETVCEYIGSNLIYEILGSSNRSPKVRLHKQGEKVTLLSKIIPGFSTIHDLEKGSGRCKDIKNAKGFTLFFYANALLCNYDIHAKNAGLCTIEDEDYWAVVDLGRALSYHMRRANIYAEGLNCGSKPLTISEYIFTIFNCNRGRAMEDILYNASLYAVNFSCHLLQADKKINTRYFPLIIQQSMKNLRTAYGDDFLTHPEVHAQLTRRMGLDGKTPLTEESVTDSIMGHVNRLREDARATSRKRIAEIFALDPDIVAESYVQSLEGKHLNYNRFFALLEKKNIDLTTLLCPNNNPYREFELEIRKEVDAYLQENRTGCIQERIKTPRMDRKPATPKSRILQQFLVTCCRCFVKKESRVAAIG